MSVQPVTPYAKGVTTSLPYEKAIDTVKSLLKDEGFGVLCEIDVAKIMHEKLGVDFRPYCILGACNPTFAHNALMEEAQLGLLLPCNVVVAQQDGATLVCAVDARALLSIVGNPKLLEMADEVNTRLTRVLERLPAVS